ncbi:PREDICTED: WD repeat-containing protein on Y chromosome-like [Nicrophorus vespilloides]|uniref:WD repeat-containing protein on Y chromosome-like n=1 Tax=Nicrophorus vespilloides TaxID=110193 RepID=A0ABM1MYG9_NICVS|nr:PREDICTED: WD repeat-containing protein on Y chromosome-like [Nicrophorus vespilloides]
MLQMNEETVEILQQLNEVKLQQLKETFKNEKDGCVGKETFTTSFAFLFDDVSVESIALNVFAQIDMQNVGSITWSDFLDFVLEIYKPKDDHVLELLETDIITPPHLKRDPITKIVLIETSLYFCYAIISKYGSVGLYDGNLDFLTSYHALMAREDMHRNEADKRRRNRWVADAMFISEIQMFLVSASCRSLTVYDASGLQHVPIWLILGFPDSIQSMSYNFDERCKLYLVNNCCYSLSNELPHQKEFVIIKNLGRPHVESVNGLECFHNSRTFISTSKDPTKSVIIKDTEYKSSNYVFKMRRGVQCFAISDGLKSLITGSDDGTIRIWNWLVPSKATAVLRNHKSGIIDIVLLESLKIFISCSRDGVLKVWDLIEQKCVQSIHLNFPCFEIEGRSIEWGSRCIFPGPKRQDINYGKWERDFLLVTCCNSIRKMKLLYMDGRERDFDSRILSPPPLLNSVLIPKNWKIFNVENEHESTVDEIDDLSKLKFILDKDVLGDGKSQINYKISKLEDKKMQMRWAVEKCAPHLALDLYDIKELELSSSLPVDVNKRTKNLFDRTQRLLVDAATRSVILSEQSSSSKSPRSSRSSIIEFDDL